MVSQLNKHVNERFYVVLRPVDGASASRRGAKDRRQ
ncbi:MAG: hypothetical protein ACJAQ9_002095 [Ilumatobacter sp.]|jgi:hypothetical protein